MAKNHFSNEIQTKLGHEKAFCKKKKKRRRMRRWKCEKNASFERCAPIGCLRVTWLLGGGNVEMKCPLPIGRAISSSSSIATALTNTAESIRLPPLITIIKFILFSLLSSTFFAISLAILHCRTQLMRLCNPTNAFSSRNPI